LGIHFIEKFDVEFERLIAYK